MIFTDISNLLFNYFDQIVMDINDPNKFSRFEDCWIILYDGFYIIQSLICIQYA